MGSPKHGVRGFPVVPHGEARCVWMLAGVVSYKLCNLDHNCEICPLDQALRDVVMETIPYQKGGRAAQDMYFNRNHTWVRVEAPHAVTVGLDDFLLRLFHRIDRLTLPEIGTRLARGGTLAGIWCGDCLMEVSSPISGTIVELNAALLETPGLAIENPTSQGWLVVMKPAELAGDVEHLLAGQTALGWHKMELNKLETMIATFTDDDRQRLGPLMQDGHGNIGAFIEILGEERYYKIVRSFLTVEED